MASGSGRVSGLRCEYNPPMTCEARGSRSVDANRSITSGIRLSFCGNKNSTQFCSAFSGDIRGKMVRQGETVCVVARTLPHRAGCRCGLGGGFVHSSRILSTFDSSSIISAKFGEKEGCCGQAELGGNATRLLRRAKKGAVRVDGAVTVVEDGDVLSSGDDVSLEDSEAGYPEELADSQKMGNRLKGQMQDSNDVSILYLMGLWERLASEINHLPGDPTVVAQAMKLALAYAPSHVLSKSVKLAAQIADCNNQDVEPFSTDVIAAAILASAFASHKVFPSKLVTDKMGRDVAHLGNDIFKVSKLPSRINVYDDDAAAAARELCLAFYDIKAIIVEVLNRLLQLETILAESDTKHDALNQCLALEALQLYAPLGHALGLNQESLALENLSLKFLFPTSYQQTCDWLSAYVSHHNNILETSRRALENAIVSNEAFSNKARGVIVQARAKSPISTLKKLLRLGNSSQGGRTREEIFDVLGLRAIVLPRKDIKDEEQAERFAIEACYIVEQIAMELWPVTDSRAKDYIAAPKANGYSSIHHTVVVGGDNFPSTNLELQIRTAMMHEEAERGDAAHSAYKGGLTVSQAEKLKELKETSCRQSEMCEVDMDAGEALFRSIDLNGDGEVNLQELKSTIEDLGVESATSSATSLLEAADKNQDGVISLEEFMEYQRLIGLSTALVKMDEAYAAALPPLPPPSPIKRASPGISPPDSGVGNGSQEDSLHIWRSNRTASIWRTKVQAFTEGEEPVSSGSLDDVNSADTSNGNHAARKNSLQMDNSIATVEGFNGANGLNQSNQLDAIKPERSPIEPTKGHQDTEPTVSTDRKFGDAFHGFRRLFNRAGTELIEASWSLKSINAHQVLDAAGQDLQPIHGQEIPLPRHGPTLFGAVFSEDNDYILDIPTISARHARLEVIRDRIEGLSKCLIMDLGSTNGIWVNRSKITPFKEVNLFPGDVICFAEPNISFQVVAGNDKQDAQISGLAVRHGLRIAEALESDAASRGVFAPSLPAGSDVNKKARLLMTNNEHQAAYMLLLGEVMKNPSDAGTWAQLAALERQRSRRRMQNSNAGTVRAFFRASVECYESLHHEEERRSGLAKVFKSWAQLEFDVRNDGPARMLFQKSLQCLQKLKNTEYSKAEMAKTLFTWATREWKLNNVIVAAKLCKQALDSDPKNAYVLTLFGRLYCEIGDYDSARNMFKMALLSNKKHISALQAWGAMEASQKKLDKARILFRTALSVEPKNQFVTQAWAVAEGNAGNVKNASTLFAKCVEDHPKCRAAWHGWAKLEDEQGSKAKARELYRKVLELKPKSKRTLAALGRLERLDGNLNVAEELLRKALHFDNQHAASLQELSMLLKQKKQLTEAHTLEKKVRRINAAQRTQMSRVRQMKMEFLDD